MRGLVLVAAGVLSGLFSGQAMAWDKLPSDDGCAFYQSFDGPGSTAVIVSQTKKQFSEGEVMVVVSNDNWSIKLGDKLDEPLSLWADDDAIIGPVIAGDHSFAIYPSFAELEAFANTYPSHVDVKKGNQKIDSLDFSGFNSAFLSFGSCRRPWVAERATRERMENIEKNLPKDPFAKK